MTEPIIQVRDLRREFVRRLPEPRLRNVPRQGLAGRLRRARTVVAAVDGLTFDLAEGAAVGYIGANGAGKSTTIKMLTGILVPTAGTVRTCGLDPVRRRRELARQIGVVFGQRSQLWWDLPLAESFRALAAIHRLPESSWPARRDELVDRLDLGGFLATPVRQLSLGQRIRGEIAAALLHSPRLLILDEPTIGLDVLSKERLRVFLAEQRALHGTTLLLTTHDMDDVQRLTDRVLVVDRPPEPSAEKRTSANPGRLIYDGTLAGLSAQVGAERVMVVDLVEPVPDLGVIDGAHRVAVESDGLRHRLAFTPERTTAGAILQAIGRRGQVRDLAIEEPDIEDVVRRLYLAAPPP